MDLYLPPEDNECEVKRMPNAEFRPFNSIYGHFASSALNPNDVAFFKKAIEADIHWHRGL